MTLRNRSNDEHSLRYNPRSTCLLCVRKGFLRMTPFNGLGMHLDNPARLSRARTRSISLKNFTRAEWRPMAQARRAPATWRQSGGGVLVSDAAHSAVSAASRR